MLITWMIDIVLLEKTLTTHVSHRRDLLVSPKSFDTCIK